MVLSLVTGGIQSDVADTGTYTWADVISLNSPSMTAQTAINGRIIYRWTGKLIMLGTSTLNITNQTIDLIDGQIRANGSSTINIGQITTVLSQLVYSGGCQLLISLGSDQGYDANNSNLSYTTGSDRSSTTSKINIYDSLIDIKAGAFRCNLFFSNIYNSLFYTDSGDTGSSFVYLQTNSTLAKTRFTKISIELLGLGITVKDFETAIPTYGFMNFTGQRLSITGVISTTALTSDYCVQANSPFDFIDSTVDLTKGYVNSGGTQAQSRKLASQYIKIQSGLTAIANAYVSYTGHVNANIVTALDGLFNANLVFQETNITGSSYPYVNSLPIIDYSAYAREIRSYLHNGINESITVNSALGTINQPYIYALTVDSGITQTVQATAASVTGIAHAGNTITVSITHSIAEIYDSKKAYWRDNGGTTGVKIGNVANFANINITITTGVSITSSPAKFADGLQTSGIITLTDARIYNDVPFNVASGGSVIVAPGNTDLRGWTFAAGTTINVSSTTALVTVNDTTGITAGTGVTLQIPQATIRFHGMPTVSNTILFVQDLTTNVITYPTIANGESTVTVIATRSYKIRADAPGYLASSFVTVSGASVDYQFSLTDYRALYLSGVNRSSQITFNPTTYLITISDATPTLSFADVFTTIEDYLATPQGLNYTAHPYPVVLSDRNILQFPYDTTVGAVNPARIKPAATNTTDPALLFETYLERAADPSYGLFDFSTSNGRIIRIRSVVAIAQVASATIAPTSQQIRDALTIPASSTVVAGSIDSKLALIPTTDASIPIAAIKTQTDKFVFTTVGRVDATAIGVPTNPLVTTDSRLNNLDALVSSRASQITLNAIPINPLLTTDTRLSNLDALVSSRATQASINALPTLTAIEGSIVLFKSSSYTAPDNAGIGSLNSKLTTIRTDNLDRLPNLDALVTSRATPDQVWAVSYLSLTQVGTIGRLLYWIGKMFGATSTSVTASNTARTTGDGTINQTITTNPDGSKTMSGNP